MKICIDIDDYHSFPKWDCSDILIKLIEIFPQIKFTVFITPYMKRIPLTDYPQAIDRIVELIENGNIELFLHGFTHERIIRGEFGSLTEGLAKRRITKSENILKRASIPYKKGIKFPWDLYNNNVLRLIEKQDYILFTNKIVKNFKIKSVVWKNFKNIQKRYIQTADYPYGKPGVADENNIIYYHAHAQNMRKNGIRESYKNFVNEIRGLLEEHYIEFIFCSQLTCYFYDTNGDLNE